MFPAQVDDEDLEEGEDDGAPTQVKLHGPGVAGHPHAPLPLPQARAATAALVATPTAAAAWRQLRTAHSSNAIDITL